MTRRLGIAVGAVAIALAGLFVVRCAELPVLNGRTETSAIVDTADTRLGKAIQPQAAAHLGTSGVYPLLDGGEAFAARMALAQAAERSLDVQYYIWRSDRTGTLLFEALRAAADRGVRVRLLLDDNNTSGLDAKLAALDAHPNIEVRLFNPFVYRHLRLLGYLTDFSRLNRRMHNRSPRTARRRSSAGATSATSISMPRTACCSRISTSWPSGRSPTRWAATSTGTGRRIPPTRSIACCQPPIRIA
jgi:putative cardiolipin synthase